MMTDGETFVYRNDRPTRPVSRQSQERQRYEPSAGDRMARLEATVERLEATITHLETALDEARKRPQAQAQPQAQPPRQAAPAPAPAPVREEARVLQMEAVEVQPVPPAPADVKVSLYAGGSATAMLGQVRVSVDESE